MGPLLTHSWTLPNSILIESQIHSKRVGTPPIFDWLVSLVYATTFLSILLFQYIFKLIPCSELSFVVLTWGPHQLANKDSRLRTHAKNPSWFTHQLANEDSRLRTYENFQWILTLTVKFDKQGCQIEKNLVDLKSTGDQESRA